MYRVRQWSVRYARYLNMLYEGLETVLVALHPLFVRIGYQRVERWILIVEEPIKSLLFDSQSCGQCTLSSTGMACPMNCPKTLRNGPCGGVRPDGGCEVKPDMICVWVTAWEGSQRVKNGEQAIQIVQNPVDARLTGSSAWLRAARDKLQQRAR
ncbi:MAG: hypothetical protein ACI9B9_000605 [Halioglobus sp.]|jgi:hypothetical protein